MEQKQQESVDANRTQATFEPNEAIGPVSEPTPVVCKRCHLHVVPLFVAGKGLCPHCRRFVGASRRGEPVDTSRLDQLLKEFTDHYLPQGPHATSLCRQLANVVERIERVRPGTSEYARLIDDQQQIHAALESARRPVVPAEEPESLTLEALLDQIDAIRTTVVRDLRHEAETEQRQAEEEASAARRELLVPEAIADPEIRSQSEGVSAQTDTAICPHCSQQFAACTTMRTARPDVWSALHHQHPDEIERRRREATAVMLATMRHGSGITRW